MFDDLRQEAEATPFEEETPVFVEHRPPPKPFLGMKPWQRFVIALILLMMVYPGPFTLLVTEAIYLPSCNRKDLVVGNDTRLPQLIVTMRASEAAIPSLN
jgi:hypothetical protein